MSHQAEPDGQPQRGPELQGRVRRTHFGAHPKIEAVLGPERALRGSLRRTDRGDGARRGLADL